MQRRIYVNATSWRRIDVDTSLFWRHVPARQDLIMSTRFIEFIKRVEEKCEACRAFYLFFLLHS